MSDDSDRPENQTSSSSPPLRGAAGAPQSAMPAPAPGGSQAEGQPEGAPAAGSERSGHDSPATATMSATSSSLSFQNEAGPASEIQPDQTLPPRDYPRDPRLLTYAPRPPTRLPSQLLPNFLRYLGLFIFFSGTGATLLAFLYQRYLLPRLLLTKQRLASLHTHNMSNFERFLLSLHGLVTGNELVFRRSKRLLDAKSAVDPTAEIVPPPVQVADKADLKITESPEPAATAPAAPEADITKPLRDSLARLSTALSAYTNRAPAAEADSPSSSSFLPEPSASQSLLSSMESFSTYLTNESFYASTPSYPSATYGYGFGAGASAIAGMPSRSGADKEKLAQVKADIRSLKGMFLTRKNFATPSRTDGDVGR